MLKEKTDIPSPQRERCHKYDTTIFDESAQWVENGRGLLVWEVINAKTPRDPINPLRQEHIGR